MKRVFLGALEALAVLSLSLCWFFPACRAAGAAQNTDRAGESLTVEQAIALALERNRDVLKAREQVEALKGKIREVRSLALPNVKVEATGLRFRDPSFLNSTAFDKIPADFRDALLVQGANLFDYALTFSQPLYTSGKVGTAVRLSRLELEGVGNDQDRVEQEVTLEVVRTFYDLLLAGEKVGVARETVTQREKHLEVVRSRFAAGDAMEVDVLRSEVNVANAQPELIRAENAVRQARAALNHLLVRDPNAPLEARGRLEYQAWQETDLEALGREALRRRPEISRLRILDREAELQERLAQAESRMRLDLKGRYGMSARMPENLWNSSFARWSFSFEFALPVFDGGRRSGLLTQAVASRHVARLSLDQQESFVRLQVRQALDELRRAEKTVEATQLNVRQAERVLVMMQNNYRYGAATTLDVVDAQMALSLARTNLLQGLYDHVIGAARLRWVMGRPVLPGTMSGKQ
jgi:HAE1 family hydrophobic/amphiphilic exporter-1